VYVSQDLSFLKSSSAAEFLAFSTAAG
jgi:hypothetical protein